MFGRGDADCAGGLVAQLADRGQFGLDLLEPRTDVEDQPFPRLGGSDAARGAGEEADAQSRLQVAQGPGCNADCETPSWAAERVKLRSRATARKALRPERLSRRIMKLIL